jgi:integrase
VSNVLPRNDETGKRRQKWHSGYRTKRDADRALSDILHRLDQGNYVEPTRKTLSEFLDEWLKATRSTRWASTDDTYGRIVKSYLKPQIGSLPLRSITGATLNNLYADLLSTGRVHGKGGLSPASVRYVHAVIRKALKDAVRWNLVTRNAADAADPPRIPRAQIKTWSAREVRRFLDHVKDDRLYAAHVVACTTGMRRGEVLGLHWQDIDLEHGRVSVTRSLTVVDGYKTQFTEPKTAHGRRMVALDDTTVGALRKHKQTQMLERALMGDAYEDSDLALCREDGTRLHPDAFADAFYRHAKAAGLPRIRFHDLRHTHATLALAAGVHPKVVSERLGHASVTITLDTYSHAIPAMQETAAELVASRVRGLRAPILRHVRNARVVLFVTMLALGSAVYFAATSLAREAATSPKVASTRHASCPQGILAYKSTVTPIAEVLRSAQRLLAQQTFSVQGTTYHLTPRHAPIDFIMPLYLLRSPVSDEQVPGRATIHRAAARLCGERTAQASWAIRYELPISIIVGSAGYPFFVKTRTGWRFWGYWCGAGHSRAWRTEHCR